MTHPMAEAYHGQTVLITGHTGFKGSWLTTWLNQMGAKIVGFSLETPPTQPSNFELAGLSRHISDHRGDLADLDALVQIIRQHSPDIIFHLAAQPIVFHAFRDPRHTFLTNALGTVNVLEATRLTGSVRALVCITTDKVYENHEWLWGYRENDRLGGHDPYSASKSMAELAVGSYRQSYFAPDQYDEHGVAVATVRAGNVIGGGDFADYRLVPDCMRTLMAGEAVPVRNPASIRPWQHVLEPLSGYLWLGARLLSGRPELAGAWNFGPLEHAGVTAQELVEELIRLWGSGTWKHVGPKIATVETGQLRLSWEKSAACLHWRPVYTWREAAAEIVDWFKAYRRRADMYEVCSRHIEAYVGRARNLGLAWAREHP